MTDVINVLIVDDEELPRSSLRTKMSDCPFSFIESECAERTLSIIETQKIDLCFLDMQLDSSDKSNLDGLKLIPILAKKGIYTVIMSAHSSSSLIEEAYSLGCKDYLTKKGDPKNISLVINRFLLKREGHTKDHFFNEILPTNNSKQKKIIDTLLKVIPTESPIFLEGETGTGKTYLAEQIHKLSGRKGQFVSIDCSVLNENLLESELFGYIKGAFTGAIADKKGKLELANEGTLFIDEINSMSSNVQAKLLKVLEEKYFFPVASNKKIYSDFRIICASNINISKLIQTQKLRPDLYHRIAGCSITLLPLRERKEDIALLLEKKLSELRQVVIHPDAKEALYNYAWPGNIRELLRFINDMSQSDTGRISKEYIDECISKSPFTALSSFSNDVYNQLYIQAQETSLSKVIEDVTENIILCSLQNNQGSVNHAAKELGISRATLYRSIKTKTSFNTNKSLSPFVISRDEVITHVYS